MRKPEPLARSGVLSYMRFLGALVVLALPFTAHGQDAGISSADPELEAFRRMIDADPFSGGGEDPLGRDEAIRGMSLPGPDEIVEPRISPRTGEVLTAIPGVRESAHHTHITLRDGLALVHEELHFESNARVPAEVRYRLSVPEGAVLTGLSVCQNAGCRAGMPANSFYAYDDAVRARSAHAEALPIAHAERTRDERGLAIVIDAAPIAPRRDALIAHVHWAVRTPIRGGQIRFVLPPRGNDARIVPMELSVHAVDLVSPAVNGRPIELRHETPPANVPLLVEASLPITAGLSASGYVVPCDRGRCARLRVVASRPEIGEGDVVIAIDASPSTLVSARGRIAPAARALVSMLPSNARVRVLTFASRAIELSHGWSSPAQLASVPLESAVERELGPATRFEALFGEMGPWVTRGVRLVVIGDGGMTESEAARAAFDAAARQGMAISSVNVADRSTTGALRAAIERVRGLAVDVGGEAEEAAGGRGDGALVARLMALLATTSVRRAGVITGSRRMDLGSLSSGEELVWEGAIETRQRVILEVDGSEHAASVPDGELALALRALADEGRTGFSALDSSDLAGEHSCHVGGPYRSASAVGTPELGIAQARIRRCESEVGSSERFLEEPESRPSRLPPEALRYSLRRRVIPAARACFRDDRAGRVAYQVRVVIRMELGDREITAAEVDGSIDESLRQCLLAALDRVEIPNFDGRIRAHWPLYTEAEMAPPVLELWPEVADEVDRMVPSEERPRDHGSSVPASP